MRRNYVRGEFRDRKKSRRSSRALPMEQLLLARELELLYQRSAYQGDDDLVFGHPESGKPLDRSKLPQALQGVAQARRRARRPLP